MRIVAANEFLHDMVDKFYRDWLNKSVDENFPAFSIDNDETGPEWCEQFTLFIEEYYGRK